MEGFEGVEKGEGYHWEQCALGELYSRQKKIGVLDSAMLVLSYTCEKLGREQRVRRFERQRLDVISKCLKQKLPVGSHGPRLNYNASFF
jgi:hypothetical protein